MTIVEFVRKVRLRITELASKEDFLPCLKIIENDIDNTFLNERDSIRFVDYILTQLEQDYKEDVLDRTNRWSYEKARDLKNLYAANLNKDKISNFSIKNLYLAKAIITGVLPDKLKDNNEAHLFFEQYKTVTVHDVSELIDVSSFLEEFEVNPDDDEKSISRNLVVRQLCLQRLNKYLVKYTAIVRENIREYLDGPHITNDINKINTLQSVLLHIEYLVIKGAEYIFPDRDYKFYNGAWKELASNFIDDKIIPMIFAAIKEQLIKSSTSGYKHFLGRCSGSFGMWAIQSHGQEFLETISRDNFENSTEELNFVKWILDKANMNEPPEISHFFANFMKRNKVTKIAPLILHVLDKTNMNNYNGSLQILLDAKPRKFSEQMLHKLEDYRLCISKWLQDNDNGNDVPPERIAARKLYLKDLESCLEYNNKKKV